MTKGSVENKSQISKMNSQHSNNKSQVSLGNNSRHLDQQAKGQKGQQFDRKN